MNKLEPTGLAAAIAAHDRILAVPASADDRSLIAEIVAAYLSALPAAPMPGVKATVRALVWQEPSKSTNGCWIAESALGTFHVVDDGGWWSAGLRDNMDWEWEPENHPRTYEGPATAQRACQSYLDQRILSALDVPAHPEGVKEFAQAILHGDDEHRAWLEEAAEAFVAGLPMPAPRGKGTASPISHPEPVAQEEVACPSCGGNGVNPEGILRPDGMLGDCEICHGDGTVPSPSPEQGEDTRDIYDVANQLEGYVDPSTPKPLAQFLMREGKAACKLADEISALRARVAELEARATPQAGASEAQPVAFKNGPVMAQFSYGQFLNWIADRMQHVHGENPNYDYMHRLREIADWLATPPDSDAVRAERERCAKIAARLLKGYDNGDDGFGVEEAIRSGRAAK